MGVETPIPPIMMNSASPGGAPPRRITLKTINAVVGDPRTGYSSLSQWGCPSGGVRLVHRNQEEEKISSEIFDVDVEEPPALLLFRV
jgi:hypothetical protein